MSDFSPAIIRAVEQTCPNTTHLKCTYHFSTIIKKRVTQKHFSKSLLLRAEIPAEYLSYFAITVYLNKKKTNYFSPIRVVKFDISILMKLPNAQLFNKFIEIITPFWEKYCPNLLQIFKDEYFEFQQKSGWQYYISSIAPKTNNCVESFNRTLKDYVTERKAEDFSKYYRLNKEHVVHKSQQAQQCS